MDRLMVAQLTETRSEQRKRLYDRVQEILAENQPMIFLASPGHFSGREEYHWQLFIRLCWKPYVLWNVEQLYLRNGPGKRRPVIGMSNKPPPAWGRHAPSQRVLIWKRAGLVLADREIQSADLLDPP